MRIVSKRTPFPDGPGVAVNTSTADRTDRSGKPNRRPATDGRGRGGDRTEDVDHPGSGAGPAIDRVDRVGHGREAEATTNEAVSIRSVGDWPRVRFESVVRINVIVEIPWVRGVGSTIAVTNTRHHGDSPRSHISPGFTPVRPRDPWKMGRWKEQSRDGIAARRVSAAAVLVTAWCHPRPVGNLPQRAPAVALTVVGAYVTTSSHGTDAQPCSWDGLVEAVMFLGRQIGHATPTGTSPWWGWRLGVWPRHRTVVRNNGVPWSCSRRHGAVPTWRWVLRIRRCGHGSSPPPRRYGRSDASPGVTTLAPFELREPTP